MATVPETDGAPRFALWDVPVRIVHWSFVALLPWLWLTWKSGNIALHKQLGYGMLALLVFRLFWGVAGSRTARFSSFVRGPRGVARYIRQLFSKESEPVVGHNPLGGWSVLALLGLLIVQTGTGLFTQDVDGIESGPLTYLISYDAADATRGWHGFLFDILLALVALHVAAILFYLLVKRDNLVGPMVTGRKRWRGASPPPTMEHAPAWLIAVGGIVGAASAWWVALGCPI